MAPTFVVSVYFDLSMMRLPHVDRIQGRTALTAILVLGLALAALPPASLGAQGRVAPAAAIAFAQSYDPVAGRYVRVLLEPLPAAAVREIQLALARTGHSPGAATGVLDRDTRAAVRDFQAENGLRITSQPDYETVAALGIPLRPGTGAEVDRARKVMPARDYDYVIVGPADSLGFEAPTVGGVGALPANPGVEPLPTPGATPVPDPGAEPVPEPGVGPAPAPGVQGTPVTGEPPPTPSGQVVPTPSPDLRPAPATPDSAADR